MWEHDEDAIRQHYGDGVEVKRLQGLARLEFLRTIEIIGRYIPGPPAVVADIGGGPGTYSFPLARQGHRVHLLDPMDSHVLAATEISGEGSSGRLETITQGVAQDLPWTDDSVDVCLFFGPMYHLTSAAERQTALREAFRVLRADGIILATAISRFASTFAGLARGYLESHEYQRIVETDVRTGHHRNASMRPEWFTTAYYHRPELFVEEIRDAGFAVVALVAVDGPGGYLSNLDWWLSDPNRREALLESVRRVEGEPSILGASPQMLAVAYKSNEGEVEG